MKVENSRKDDLRVLSDVAPAGSTSNTGSIKRIDEVNFRGSFKVESTGGSLREECLFRFFRRERNLFPSRAKTFSVGVGIITENNYSERNLPKSKVRSMNLTNFT